MGRDMSSAHSDLEMIGRQIVKKCDGLPLAAKVLGGALRFKRVPREWMEILESNMWDLDNDNILPVLKISYQFLPSQLKRCFAYCAVFPKDYAFDKEQVIRLWMAEGLLTQSEGNKDIEQVGEGCFDDLVSRSFFQKSTERKCFLMHDLINDLAKSISGEFCFRYGVDRPCKVPERIRHLWVGDEEEYEVDKLISEDQHLRTLLCFVYEQKEVVNLLPTFTRLRVLGLRCHKLPDSIGDLMHLRYLNLSNSSMERLPDSVVSLWNLETLILFDCCWLVQLPATIFKLINLSQLDIRETGLRKMPPHMGKLKKLGELDYYIVGEESHCSIKELGPLKRLGGHLRIEKLRNVSQVQESEEANLKDKEKLKELELIWNDDEGSDDEGSEVSSVHERNVLEQLQPHTNIEKISISGYAGTRFPDWVGDFSFSKMVGLKLKGCKYCFSLPALGQLGSLKRLSIIEFEEITVVGPEFYGKSNKPPFGCLESLTFRGMRQWREWVPYSSMDEGDGPTAAFPLLQELVIEDCPNLIKTLPVDLPSLRKLIIRNLTEGNRLDLGPALEEINIDNCGNLKCLLAAELEHLKSLRISFCPNLKEIQPTYLPSLTKLRIMWCDSLESFPLNLGPALQQIEIGDCKELNCLSAAAELEHLESLKIGDCPNLMEIQLTHLPSLRRVEIMCCDSLGCFPLDLWPAIQQINIWKCKKLKCLSAAATAELEHLESLEIRDCPNLMEIQLTHLPSLRRVKIMRCDSLECFSLDLCPALQQIKIWDCEKLKCLSAAATAKLEHLKSLEIVSCPKPKEILPTHLPSLTLLRIWGCDQLVSLPRAPALQQLKITKRLPLTQLPAFGNRNRDSYTSLYFPLDLLRIIFPNLSHLELESCCEEVESFPPKNLLPPTLICLAIEDFPNLKSFDSTALQSLTCLRELSIYNCPELQSLPKQGLPSSLQRVEIFGCPSLQVGQDWPFDPPY